MYFFLRPFGKTLTLTKGFLLLQKIFVRVGGHNAVNAFRLSIPHLQRIPMTRYKLWLH